MEAENLTQIVELLKTVSGDASSAVITYFVISGLIPLLKFVVGWSGAYYIVKLITNLFSVDISNKETK